MIRKSLLPTLAIAGIALAIAMVIADSRSAPKAQSSGPAATAAFASYIFGPGIVEASTENISLGTPVSGIVSAIYVKWGDRVKAGAPLFKIDARDLEAQLVPATARVKEAEAQLSPANAKVKEAEAVLAKAQSRLQTGESLEPGVSISSEELANRRLDVDAVQAGVASAQAQIDQIHAQIASAQAQVEQIEREMQLRTVRAPVPGRILQIKTHPGEYAQAGAPATPLMLLGDDAELHVRVDIDENDASRFDPCASAVASIRGNPAVKISLRYAHTDPAVIPKSLLTGDATQRTDTRVLQVIYSFDPGSLPLYIGQQMDVFIEAPAAGANPGAARSDGKPCGGGPAIGKSGSEAGRRP